MAEIFATQSAGDAEVERLTRVYNAYAGSAAAQARWDDDNPGNRAMAAERRAAMARLLGEHGLLPLASRRVLDVGCGSGKTLADLRALGASADHLFGIDLLIDRAEQARASNPGVRIDCGSAEHLPFPDGDVDLVAVATVFSSILDHALAMRVANEITRVLRHGGAVLWYDVRYPVPRNPNVRCMSARTIRSLFPSFRVELRPLTVLPPLARRLGSLTPVLYPPLSRAPLVCGHYLGLLIKP